MNIVMCLSQCTRQKNRREGKKKEMKKQKKDADASGMIHVAGHRVLWVGPAHARCGLCRAHYALGNMHRYAWMDCTPEARTRPTSRLPGPRRENVDKLLIPRHSGKTHAYAPTIYKQQISGEWKVDANLPIERNGHVPVYHPTMSVLRCLRRSFTTRGELSGF